jgi:hypothetical protein
MTCTVVQQKQQAVSAQHTHTDTATLQTQSVMTDQQQMSWFRASCMYQVLPLRQGHTYSHNSALELGDYKPTLESTTCAHTYHTRVPAQYMHQTFIISHASTQQVMRVYVAITSYQTQTIKMLMKHTCTPRMPCQSRNGGR